MLSFIKDNNDSSTALEKIYQSDAKKLKKNLHFSWKEGISSLVRVVEKRDFLAEVRSWSYLGSIFGKLSSGRRTGKVSFHSNPKEGQCQRMFKLPDNCIHFTGQQSNAQNFPSQASTVHELRTSRCSSWFQKRQRNQKLNSQHPLDHRKSKKIPVKTSTSASLTMLKPLTMWMTINCGKFKRW